MKHSYKLVHMSLIDEKSILLSQLVLEVLLS